MATSNSTPIYTTLTDVTSILSWAVLIAIVAALIEALCTLLRVITQKQELCEAFSRLLASF
jgi:hypothetical protein